MLLEVKIARKGDEMRKYLRFMLITILLVGVGLTGLVVLNDREAGRRNQIYDQASLTGLDKVSLEETFSLHEQLGNKLWPGFADAEIPIIIFNDTYEFISGIDDPGPGWQLVEGDNINLNRYYYRPAQNPQAFTTKLDSGWAASMTSLNVLNREIFLMLRQELPRPFNRLLPHQLVTYGNDYHITTFIHESFHAFQALTARDKFDQAQRVYGQENLYPYQDDDFRAAWNEEGKLLSAALAAERSPEKLELIAEFLLKREQRRSSARLSPADLAYEKNLEWLEGLAKYIEIEFYELAADSSELTDVDFASDPKYWDEDIKRLSGSLGEHDGHNRFYLSGMAQAQLLQQLGVVGWKEQVMEEDVFLDDMLENCLVEVN